ncbi:MAG: hypothetical protein CVU62_13840 [Deltaproteobacteria bacterium HGW-Deltaproteobacteria-2]|jgi:hypothetical protein|nr:MAG: hypothetical protein CVU62_13840 [Deltaproteobacteria bacterium HGW-Deltaproteobacteria-2]
MLMSELILAVLPRLGRAPVSGITVFQAATSIQSLIYKNLLDKKSDLQATGDLNLSIAAFGYYATLPSNFISLAERPRYEELITNWMAGTVTSYNSATGALVVNVTSASGTDTLATWNIAVGATPGTPAATLGTSTTSVVCGTGTKSLTTQTGLSLTTGQYVIISTENSDEGWTGYVKPLQPNYLNDDADDHDVSWWDWYSYSSLTDNYKPDVYKIIGSTFYLRPTPAVDILVKGKYNAIPTVLTLATQTIPWEGKFDEIFTEGVVRIITKGISIPDTDVDFMTFFNREFSTVVISRASIIPRNGRLKAGNYL